MWENLYENLKNDSEIRELIRRGNANLGVLGYTDHSPPKGPTTSSAGGME